MSLREGYPRSGAYYCLSLSRGGAVRTVALPQAGAWAIAAIAVLAFAWTAAVTLYVAFHDDVLGAILARQAEIKAVYEDRLAEARARFDEAAGRQLLERNAFRSKVDRPGSNSAARSSPRSPPRHKYATRPGLRGAKPRPQTRPTRSAQSKLSARRRRPAQARTATAQRAPTPLFVTRASPLAPSSPIRSTKRGRP
jgi:hypothetical protein